MNVQVENLTKLYGDKAAIKNISFNIKPGQILGLLGPNGAGKSTTIKILSGQTAPDSGKIFLDGVEYSKIPNNLRGKIGVMPQEVIIWEELNVKENLLFTGRMHDIDKVILNKRVEELIESLNLQSELKTLAKHLSGGFKRRLNLALSIIHEPSLIFLDEPTPGIDPQNRRFLWEFINSLKNNKERSLVLTDHYLDEAEKLCDYVVIIDNGELIAEGTVNQLKEKYCEDPVNSSLEDLFLILTGHKIRE